ncbi:transcriptional regulator [Streptomyces sp. NPDC058001]|uniref:transcriptional regulator n=1 Tax=Streptomyces sp. NPDC058001 TaxID=3346300 RepID=UPI0036EC0AD5
MSGVIQAPARKSPEEKSAVSPMLLRLARERATGALIRDQGTLYLADGRIVHAESPAAPGLDILLTRGGTLPPEGWWDAVAEAGARNAVGRHLVDSGRLAEGALQMCHLGALFDAAYFVLGPTSGPTRFRYGVAHWLGRVQQVDAGAVDRESRRRRALLDGVWPGGTGLDTAPVVPRTPAPEQPVGERLRAVLRLADGVRTPSAIAWELGRPAFHTLIEVRRLAAAGLVESAPEAGAGTEASAGVGTASGVPPAVPPWITDAFPTPITTPITDPTADPDVALLRRLRDALEATL